MTQQQETATVAVACLIGILGGLLLPKALFVSLDRGLLVWLVAVISSGIVLGTGAALLNLRQILMRALFVSTFPSVALSGFLVVRWLFSRLIHPEAIAVFIPLGSGAVVDPLSLSALTILSVLFLIGTLASFVVVALAALGANPIVEAAARFWAFGPSGMSRLRRLLGATVAVVGAVIVLWAAFSA